MIGRALVSIPYQDAIESKALTATIGSLSRTFSRAAWTESSRTLRLTGCGSAITPPPIVIIGE